MNMNVRKILKMREKEKSKKIRSFYKRVTFTYLIIMIKLIYLKKFKLLRELIKKIRKIYNTRF